MAAPQKFRIVPTEDGGFLLIPVAIDAIGSNVFNFNNERSYNYADNNSHITNISPGPGSIRIFNDNAVNQEKHATVNQPITIHDNQNRGNLAVTCLDNSCRTPVGTINESPSIYVIE